MSSSQCKYYLEQKLNLCKKLLKTTEELYNTLIRDDGVDLEKKMEMRTKIIKEIDHLDSVYSDKCDLQDAFFTEYRDDINCLRQFLLDIQEIDIRIMEEIPFLKEKLLKNYNQIKKARKIKSVYKGTDVLKGYILDKKR